MGSRSIMQCKLAECGVFLQCLRTAIFYSGSLVVDMFSTMLINLASTATKYIVEVVNLFQLVVDF